MQHKMYNNKTHKNADGLTQRSSFTTSLLCLLQTHRKLITKLQHLKD